MADPITGEVLFGGKRVAFSRMLVYHYPVECLDEALVSPDPPEGSVFSQHDVVLCIDDHSIWSVGKIVAVHSSERQYTLRPMQVPVGERHGAWARRPWKCSEGADNLVPFEFCRSKLELVNDCLSQQSLEVIRNMTHVRLRRVQVDDASFDVLDKVLNGEMFLC